MLWRNQVTNHLMINKRVIIFFNLNNYLISQVIPEISRVKNVLYCRVKRKLTLCCSSHMKLTVCAHSGPAELRCWQPWLANAVVCFVFSNSFYMRLKPGTAWSDGDADREWMLTCVDDRWIASQDALSHAFSSTY